MANKRIHRRNENLARADRWREEAKSLSGCRCGKHTFRSRAAATRAMRLHKHTVSAYRCHLCWQWHLTSGMQSDQDILSVFARAVSEHIRRRGDQ